MEKQERRRVILITENSRKPFVSPPPTSSFEVLKGSKLKRSLEFLGSDF